MNESIMDSLCLLFFMILTVFGIYYGKYGIFLDICTLLKCRYKNFYSSFLQNHCAGVSVLKEFSFLSRKFRLEDSKTNILQDKPVSVFILYPFLE